MSSKSSVAKPDRRRQKNAEMSGQEVRNIRKKLDLSQQALAEAIGVSFPTVNRWENGHSHISPLSARAIRKLAHEQLGKPKRTHQRITLRIKGHPVTLDGTIKEFAPDGSWLVVDFDGPLETKTFYPFDNRCLSAIPTEEARSMYLAGLVITLWEVV